VKVIAALLLVLVAAAGCGGDDEAAPAGVEDLTDLAALRSDFEKHAGKTRVILLVAPT
jgi:ABC-type glycerol-3-phosphate transport system substrate-binding protein